MLKLFVYTSFEKGDSYMVHGIGKRLTKLRQQNNLSQTAVAERMGVSSALISAYEKGERNPSIEKIIILADIYHATTDYILGRTQPPETNVLLDVSHLSSEQIRIVRELVENMNISKKQL